MRDDDIIDRVARGLTRGEPSSRLRQAIQRRIAPRRTPWRVVRWVPAAATVLLLLVVLPRTMPAPDPHSPPEAPRATGAAVARGTKPVVPSAVAEKTPVTHARSREARLPPARVEPMAPVPPLVDIEPLVTDPITVATSVDMVPLEIEPLHIEPLELE